MSAPPPVGLGTWKIPKNICADTVYGAIKLGIRHIDCACDYGNEKQVGDGIRRALNEGLVSRSDLWITSKLWNTYHKREHVDLAAQRSLSDLGLEYFDLYLIHFPICLKFVPFETRYPPEWIYDPSASKPQLELDPVPLKETWEAMETLVDRGIAKNIGVANMCVQTLMDILSYCRVKPAVNQVELHPYLTQQPLVDFCHRYGIHVTAYSPLGSPSYIELGMDSGEGVGLLQHVSILSLARKHNKTPAQILLRWGVQRGTSVITKSSSLERIAQLIDVPKFTLSEHEMAEISKLNRNQRFNDPGEFCKGMGFAIPIYD